ncbi:phage terminase small subunit P27 family [Acidothermaceae bacterium B102]|nr:phage terminase small subunit P27 family [Acidothermaceae bacterium B102]
MPTPAKPTALKLLAGNPGQRPLNNDPVPPEGELVPPAYWAESDPEALAEWERVLPILIKMRLATVADRTALIGYCEQWSLYLTANELVRSQGLLIVGQKGNDVRNPAVQIARDALAMVKVFCTEFGLTPSARSRISIPGSSSDDDASIASILSS